MTLLLTTSELSVMPQDVSTSRLRRSRVEYGQLHLYLSINDSSLLVTTGYYQVQDFKPCNYYYCVFRCYLLFSSFCVFGCCYVFILNPQTGVSWALDESLIAVNYISWQIIVWHQIIINSCTCRVEFISWGPANNTCLPTRKLSQLKMVRPMSFLYKIDCPQS